MFFYKKNIIFRFLTGALAIGILCTAFAALAQQASPVWHPSDAVPAPSPAPLTVVIDAGHGGEDAGAISADGHYEKDINLHIAFLLCEMLKSNGVNVVMTRTEDILLYDKNADYQGRKKVLDLAARRKIAEETPGCIFVSIHMNAYPQTQYHGLQVWYSPNHPSSQLLAENIQQTVASSLQPDNDRAVKRATSSIYLLHHLHVPAVLVECGFLSNPEEAERLASKDYRQQLALALFLAITEAELSSANEK